MLPETIFMNPLAGPEPMVSPATRGTAVPPAVFTAAPTSEDFDQPRTEAENPFHQQRAKSQDTNSGQGDVRIRWSN